MKRSILMMLACLCALSIAMFGLTACGGDSSSSSSTSQASSSTASDSTGSEDEEEMTADNLDEQSVRSTFEQMLSGMSEYYHGSTPAGENLYYAGGTDGDNGIFVLLVPGSSYSIILIGPVEVGDDNVLKITDSTTNNSIEFQVFDNGDGTYSFSMGDDYGAAIMSRCSSNTIVDALTTAIIDAANESSSSEGTEGSEGAENQ